MKEITFTVTDPLGIHARPAGILVKEAKKYASKITVWKGDKVKAGQIIMTFDRDAIKKANHPDCVVVLLTNSDDFSDVKLGADAE